MYSERSRTPKMEPFTKVVNGFETLTTFLQKLHLRYSIGF